MSGADLAPGRPTCETCPFAAQVVGRSGGWLECRRDPPTRRGHPQVYAGSTTCRHHPAGVLLDGEWSTDPLKQCAPKSGKGKTAA